MKILFIGYGNPGRLDDGLGPAIAEEVEKLAIEDVTVDSNYQLTVEDAAAVANYDVVVFADASVSDINSFTFAQLQPQEDVSFTTHSINPESVLGLAHGMFKADTKGYALAIRGYKFDDFGCGISEEAADNMDKALKFIVQILKTKDFDNISN